MKKTKDINEMRLKSTSPADFAKRLEKYALSNNEKMSISFIDLYATLLASNSYNCPIGNNFKENWSRNSSLPMGYPALCGKVIMQKKNEKGKYCREALTRSFFNEIPGLHTGTGGGTGYKSEYSVILWLNDFPLWGNKVLIMVNIQEKLNKVIWENEKNKENLLSLIDSTINQHDEIRKLSEKIVKLKTAIKDEITKFYPGLAVLDTSDFEKQLAALRVEIGI